MRKREIAFMVIVLVLIFYIVLNINAINSFLTFASDKTTELNHTTIVVPEAWNTTEELNMTNESKNVGAITNNYVIYDFWEDWYESNFTQLSRSHFIDMEDGNYHVLKSENRIMGGCNVSIEYFLNPSRNTEYQWDCIGINYVFEKEDTNYAIQIHYFTESDYNNQTFMNEVNDRTEDIIANIHNTEYDGFFSALSKLYSFFQ